MLQAAWARNRRNFEVQPRSNGSAELSEDDYSMSTSSLPDPTPTGPKTDWKGFLGLFVLCLLFPHALAVVARKKSFKFSKFSVFGATFGAVMAVRLSFIEL